MMPRTKCLLVACVCAVMGIAAASAHAAFCLYPIGPDPTVFDGQSGSLAARAVFQTLEEYNGESGSYLQITLSNLGGEVSNPSQVLTAIFFNLAPGNTVLTPLSAELASGGTVIHGSDGGGNVGGEWAYTDELVDVRGNTGIVGISSTGFGLFGNASFNGENLHGPSAVNGVSYGITSQSDNPLNGNAAVRANPLIQHSVVFTLEVNGPLDGLLADIDEQNPRDSLGPVVFRYGTSLAEPSFNGTMAVPEAGSLLAWSLLFGSGWAGLAFSRRHRRPSWSPQNRKAIYEIIGRS